jgi:phospholipid/cholesterol/gamma-HCH transport system ATP-binding protein
MIRFEKVTKNFGDRKVLDALDLHIEKGETFVIVGTSGMGKSVSLKHMIRLMSPDSGEIFIKGDPLGKADAKQLSEIRSRFGVLFQGSALMQWMSCGENVALPLREKTRMSNEEIEALVYEKLKLVSLENVFHKMPSEVSGGMRKRVALARAIISEPEIILYDEPTSGLDPVTSRQIDELIDDLRQKLGVTSVVVTHDLHSALSIGSRIGMLYYGKMVEISSPEEFILSGQKQVQEFLASQYITRRGIWERTEST